MCGFLPGGFAVTILGPVMAAGCAGRFRSVAASSMAGVAGPGFFAETIRAGTATGCFRFRARFGLKSVLTMVIVVAAYRVVLRKTEDRQ
jgi:hypothetical protein